MLHRILTALLDAVFPTKCLVCGDFFPHPEEISSKEILLQYESFGNYYIFQEIIAPYLCPGCSKDFLPVEPPICPKCGIMLEYHGRIDGICDNCLQHSDKQFRIARAALFFKGNFREVIHRFKYNEKIELRKPLGIILFLTFIKYWNPKDIDIVMPVPLHIKKFRKRGFNQAYLLIKDWHQIAQMMGIDLSSLKIVRDNLLKIRHTESQTGLKGQEREENVEDAFIIRKPSEIFKKRILLVDDVYTTGSTVNECAKELLRKGAKSVDILTLARPPEKKNFKWNRRY